MTDHKIHNTNPMTRLTVHTIHLPVGTHACVGFKPLLRSGFDPAQQVPQQPTHHEGVGPGHGKPTVPAAAAVGLPVFAGSTTGTVCCCL
jgi:hypothetical protein